MPDDATMYASWVHADVQFVDLLSHQRIATSFSGQAEEAWMEAEFAIAEACDDEWAADSMFPESWLLSLDVGACLQLSRFEEQLDPGLAGSYSVMSRVERWFRRRVLEIVESLSDEYLPDVLIDGTAADLCRYRGTMIDRVQLCVLLKRVNARPGELMMNVDVDAGSEASCMRVAILRSLRAKLMVDTFQPGIVTPAAVVAVKDGLVEVSERKDHAQEAYALFARRGKMVDYVCMNMLHAMWMSVGHAFPGTYRDCKLLRLAACSQPSSLDTFLDELWSGDASERQAISHRVALLLANISRIFGSSEAACTSIKATQAIHGVFTARSRLMHRLLGGGICNEGILHMIADRVLGSGEFQGLADTGLRGNFIDSAATSPTPKFQFMRPVAIEHANSCQILGVSRSCGLAGLRVECAPAEAPTFFGMPLPPVVHNE